VGSFLTVEGSASLSCSTLLYGVCQFVSQESVSPSFTVFIQYCVQPIVPHDVLLLSKHTLLVRLSVLTTIQYMFNAVYFDFNVTFEYFSCGILIIFLYFTSSVYFYDLFHIVLRAVECIIACVCVCVCVCVYE
jgi:hypothetical protein